MSKNIVFCADGTWNSPDQDENSDFMPDPTNVYKLFLNLEGVLAPDSIREADEQEKELSTQGSTHQVAKYIHGVGDSRNPIVKVMGGAFGAGIISRIVRGYTFISRNYEDDSNIFIVGFSRGAYTARALGGLIASQGLLSQEMVKDKEVAYRRGAEAWYRYRSAAEAGSLRAHLAEIVSDLPAFLSHGSLKETDLIPVKSIASVAVWDTVGAMGLPEYVGKGRRVDAFKFADTKLSKKVSRGFHAIALDERRSDFTPTLWDPADNVTQALFPGAHCDVGGGYPTTDEESGLSDRGLEWMVNHLKSMGVVFSPNPVFSFKPNPAGTAHKPWRHGPWLKAERTFPGGIPEDSSVEARVAAGDVVAEPGEAPCPYRPTNRP